VAAASLRFAFMTSIICFSSIITEEVEASGDDDWVCLLVLSLLFEELLDDDVEFGSFELFDEKFKSVFL
jgi:hypothetical protein